MLGSWAFTANDIPLGIQMLHRVGNRYPWHLMQMEFPFTEQGVEEAVQSAMTMRCIKATIVPS